MDQEKMKRARYEELCAISGGDRPLSDDERSERVQLYYELNPDRDLGYGVTPEQGFGGRVAQRGVFKLL